MAEENEQVDGTRRMAGVDPWGRRAWSGGASSPVELIGLNYQLLRGLCTNMHSPLGACGPLVSRRSRGVLRLDKPS